MICLHIYIILEYSTHVEYFILFLICSVYSTREILVRANVFPLMVKGDATNSQEKDMYSEFGFWNVGS